MGIGSYHNIFRIGSILQNQGLVINDVIWRKLTNAKLRGTRFTNAMKP